MKDRAEGPLPAPVRRLGVLRVAEGQSHNVIFVQGGPILGLLTHYESKRSFPCDGESCLRCKKSFDVVWKGYAAVLLWDKAAKQWWPTVLEVTESLELDLRGRVQHSGMWEITRAVATKPGRHPPIVGHEMKRGPAPLLCPTFDLLPAVHWLYHDYEIKVALPSPIPGRATVSMVVAPSPADMVDPPSSSKERIVTTFSERFSGAGKLVNGIGSMPKDGAK